MKYAVIMTVHNNILQVERLCRSLENPNCYFFIHVDKKANIKKFKDKLHNIKNMTLISKYRVFWADLSQVDTTIMLLKAALKENMDYIFFISGQDYFIQKDNNLMNYVDKTKNYMEYEHLPFLKWGIDGRCNRYNYYHNLVNFSLIKFDPRKRFYKIINKLLINGQKLLQIKRKFIKNNEPFSGANWFNINKDCAAYIVSNYHKYRGYFKYVQFPDEMCIQTIILNSKFKNETINNTLRYIDWIKGPEEPRILTEEDYDDIIESKAIFARKFDENKDTKILDKLDLYRKQNRR